MAVSGSPKRYAEALFELAQERDELVSWVGRLELLVELLEHEGLVNVLGSPTIGLEHKLRVIGDLLEGESPLLRNLLALLASRQHLHLTSSILQEYQRLANAALGVAQALVITAVALEPEDEARISEHLSKMLKREIRIEPQVDPSILGGFVARVGDRLIDGSTRSRLKDLRQSVIRGR